MQLSFFVGYSRGYDTRVVSPTHPILRIIPPPITVEKEVIIEKEVIVEKYIDLKEFVSLQELEDWLEQDKTDKTLYFTGTMDLATYDCEDFALNLQKQAIKDGYYVSHQVVWNYRRPDTGELITKPNEAHALNNVVIGNNIYFVEPQTDEVWLAAYKD